MCHVSGVTCQVSHSRCQSLCHMSHVRCYLPCVRCHVQGVKVCILAKSVRPPNMCTLFLETCQTLETRWQSQARVLMWKRKSSQAAVCCAELSWVQTHSHPCSSSYSSSSSSKKEVKTKANEVASEVDNLSEDVKKILLLVFILSKKWNY